MFHYLVVILIIAIIVIVQIRSFIDTSRKINAFLWIFPKESNAYKFEYDHNVEGIKNANLKQIVELCTKYDIDSAEYIVTKTDEHEKEKTFLKSKVRDLLIAKLPKTTGIFVDHFSYILKTIVNSINDYLQNNKTVSDFHLMKDIVDRRCDAKEEEINTQIPVPLYMGLVGTMAGILIGVGFLSFSGGLDSLLENTNNGTKGIKELLGSVALAMISSILGIVLTTWSSKQFKDAKSSLESNKHDFLSWIQAKLMPTLSDNVVGAIKEMAGNLTAFNNEFSNNTSNLGTVLAKLNESYKLQTHLLDTVQKIADKDLVHQNLQLYNALKNSTSEIGKLAEYLQNCNEYLINVKELNNKLDNYENRTQFIENASKFYSKHEHWLSENYDEANRNLREVVGRYNTAIGSIFNTMKTDIEGKRQELGTFIEHQNVALKNSSGDLDKIVKSLSELGEVQKAVKEFETAIKGQNEKIDHLAEHIEKLANAKSDGGLMQIKPKTPVWQITLMSIIALSCMLLTINSFDKKTNTTETIPSESVTPPPTVSASKDSAAAVVDSVNNK